jgi:hypothetical protein
MLDSHIKALGGVSADEDFFRFGASAFGTLAATNIPTGFGFPSRVEGSWTLPAIDLTALSPSAPGTYTALGAASQTYAWPLETQSNAAGTYSRTNIVVPVGVTLHIVVK